MYDVVYHHANRAQVVGAGLEKTAACDLARAEARKRGVGRMFLAGSEMGRVGECIVIVDARDRAA